MVNLLGDSIWVRAGDQRSSSTHESRAQRNNFLRTCMCLFRHFILINFTTNFKVLAFDSLVVAVNATVCGLNIRLLGNWLHSVMLK